MTIDHFFAREKTSAYDCRHFAAEVWQYLTGEDISERLSSPTIAMKAFDSYPKPIDPCLVLMQGKTLEPHMGVFFQGRVLHLLPPPRNVEYQPLKVASVYYSKVKFYR